MTCIIESISGQIRKKPQCAKPKRESDGRDAAKTPPLEPTAPAARAARSHLAPLTPPPCALSPCALTRTSIERGAQGTRRATIGGENAPKVRGGSLNVGPRKDEILWKTVK